MRKRAHLISYGALGIAYTLLLGMATGCLPLGSAEQYSPALYVLEAPLGQKSRQQPGPDAPVLLVNIPQAVPGHETAQMAFSRAPYRLEYFSKSQWVKPPALMLQSLLVQTLGQSGEYKAVIAAPSAMRRDLLVSAGQLSLCQEFTGSSSTVRFTVQVELADSIGTILAARRFDKTETAETADAGGGVLAANRILKRLLPEISAFCALHARHGEK